MISNFKSKIKFLVVLTLVSLFLLQNVSVQGKNNEILESGVVFESYSIKTEVFETVAQTNITQIYYNPTDTLVKGTFNAIIPDRAYATNTSIKIENNTYWGRILEIKEA